MLRGRAFTVLAVVTAVVVAGASMTLNRETSLPQAGTLLFPELLERVNDVTRVEVTGGGNSFTLARTGRGAWTAPARDGYPLIGDKVHRLLVGAAGLQRLEPKTSNPERFQELGLRDPDTADARSVRFRLLDAADAVLAELIVGERRPARGDASRSEYFVRVPDEQRVWLVLGTLPDTVDAVEEWLRPDIATIAEERVARVRVTHPDGEVVTVEKDEPGAESFRYRELPSGAEVGDTWKVNDLGRLLGDLRLEDVTAADERSDAPGSRAVVLETFDGLRVRMALSGSGDQATATLDAEFDAALRAAGEDANSGPTAQEVKDEAAALNERWQPWRYRISRYKSDTAHYRASDLVKASEPPATPAPGAAGSGASGS
jgi:hypothetical protein